MSGSGLLQRKLIVTPFRGSQIPAVIVGAIGVVLSFEEGDATTRFHQRNSWISSDRLVACRTSTAAGARNWVPPYRNRGCLHESCPGCVPARTAGDGICRRSECHHRVSLCRG